MQKSDVGLGPASSHFLVHQRSIVGLRGLPVGGHVVSKICRRREEVGWCYGFRKDVGLVLFACDLGEADRKFADVVDEMVATYIYLFA